MAIAVALIFIAYMLVALISPITLAHAYNNINHNLSIKYYEKAYRRTKDVDDLYNLVNQSIEFKKDKKLVKYFPMLESHDKYEALIKYIDTRNYDSESSLESNVFSSREDNRLKTRYVSVLIKTDPEAAFDYAYQDMMNEDSREDYDFALVGLSADITVVKNYMDSTFVGDLVVYYNEVKEKYETSKSADDKFDEALLCYRSLSICQFMLLIDRSGVEGLDSVALGADKDNLTHDFGILLADGEE